MKQAHRQNHSPHTTFPSQTKNEERMIPSKMMGSIYCQNSTCSHATSATTILVKAAFMRSRAFVGCLSFWLLLLQPSMIQATNNCYIEPLGVRDCGINTTTFFTARFGIPNNNDTVTTTPADTTAGGDGVVQRRVKDCRYAWQVLAEYHDNVTNTRTGITYLYGMATGSKLTASDPNCTVDCSAIVSTQDGIIIDEPTVYTIRHRLYTLTILEGQEEDLTMEWDPFPDNPGSDADLPPKFGTFRLTADGSCTVEKWEPVPTSSPSSSMPPSSSSTVVDSALVWWWPLGLIIATVQAMAI